MSMDQEIDLGPALHVEAGEALLLSLDAYEGPLHVLLELARARKIDLAHVSVSEIADQYSAFIGEAQMRDMELAGDYLVMASWLTLLKSRLLIPRAELPGAELDPQEIEAALRSKLQRLAATKARAKQLGGLPQVGRDVFTNGAPQPIERSDELRWQVELYDLLKAYCGERTRQARKRAYQTAVRRAFPLEAARRSLEEALRRLGEWRTIEAVIPKEPVDAAAPPWESYLASTFGASLELARERRLELRQEEAFADLYLRARQSGEEGA
jgi:segregation and condensation protein A